MTLSHIRTEERVSDEKFVMVVNLNSIFVVPHKIQISPSSLPTLLVQIS